MIDPNTTEQRIYRAKSVARIEAMQIERRELSEDICRLEAALEHMKDRFARLGAEIHQEKAQWKEDQ